MFFHCCLILQLRWTYFAVALDLFWTYFGLILVLFCSCAGLQRPFPAPEQEAGDGDASQGAGGGEAFGGPAGKAFSAQETSLQGGRGAGRRGEYWLII